MSPMHHGQRSMSLSARSLSNSFTFSMTTRGGLSSAMARATWNHRPLRLPSRKPARRPAQLMSWHGKPAVRMSTGSTAAQSVTVMSP